MVEAEKEKRLFEQVHQAKAGELSVIVQQYNTTERKLRGTIRKVRSVVCSVCLCVMLCTYVCVCPIIHSYTNVCACQFKNPFL